MSVKLGGRTDTERGSEYSLKPLETQLPPPSQGHVPVVREVMRCTQALYQAPFSTIGSRPRRKIQISSVGNVGPAKSAIGSGNHPAAVTRISNIIVRRVTENGGLRASIHDTNA